MLNFANYQKKANQNQNEIPSHTQSSLKYLQTINAEEGVEKREPFHIVDRNEIGMVNTNNSMAVPHKTENKATICCFRKKMNLKCI